LPAVGKLWGDSLGLVASVEAQMCEHARVSALHRRFHPILALTLLSALACAKQSSTGSGPALPVMEPAGQAGSVGDGSTGASAEGAGSEVAGADANVRLVLDTTAVLEGGVELTLTSIVAETIEASPEDPESYPGGSGVTVSLVVSSPRRASVTLDFAQLSAGYRSHMVDWSDDLRFELKSVEDDAATLSVARVGEMLSSPPPATLRMPRGQDVPLSDNVAVRLVGHSHKMTAVDGPLSPLLVSLRYTTIDGKRHEQDLSLDVDEVGWTWRDFAFHVLDVEYGESMNVEVRRRGLVPLAAPENMP
jgi:hypothetical protein